MAIINFWKSRTAEQMTEKTKVLLTNDDGIDAPGLQALRRAISPHVDLLAVAPLSERSGAGCSLSLANEMRVEPRVEGARTWGYGVDGTPADCVKFALSAIENYRPDFVLSGINNGMNAGNSVFYSGTVAGAIEATLFGIPAMACSLACWGHPIPFYEEAAHVVATLLPWVTKQEYEPRTLWNLNIPNRKLDEMGAIRLASHGTSFFADQFKLYREEESARYYKNVGTRLEACRVKEDSDDRVVEQGDVALSLLRTDLTVDVPHAASHSLESHWNHLFDRACRT